MFLAHAAIGQNTFITGDLFSQSTFNHTDILRLSQNNNTFGTARSVAMGGAFTSLGADLSSMGINPAGLGMYMSSDAGVTSSLSFNDFNYRSFSGPNDSRTNFGINNFGVALNLYQSSRALTSFTFGFGYNKLADFNTKGHVYMSGKTTIGDVFVKQLDGIAENNATPQRLDPWDWGAALGYQTLFLDPDGNGRYTLNSVASGIPIDNMARTITRGSIGEYAISGGFNFGNKLYLGLTVGIQDIYLRHKTFYDERFYDQPTGNGYADYIGYDQYKKLSGTGVNFKFGAVYRPIEPLRIGIAVHTPTYASITMDYEAQFETGFQDRSWVADGSPVNVYDYDYQTPTRLLTGISYTIGSSAIISADYERTWYDGIRYRGGDFSNTGLNSEMKHMFKASNTFRTGVELRPVSDIALRAGYTYSSSLAQNDYLLAPTTKYDSPVGHKYYSITGGLGTVLGSFNLDVAYAYTKTKYTAYTLYSSEYSGGADITDPIFPTLNRNNILVSLGFRF